MRSGLALAVVLVSLLVLVGGPGYATDGGWHSGAKRVDSDSAGPLRDCADQLRAGSVNSDASADKASGALSATAQAGLTAPGTDPDFGIIFDNNLAGPFNIPVPFCFGIGGSTAQGDGSLHALINFNPITPDITAAHNGVKVTISGISVTSALIPPTGPILSDAGWHLLVGLQVGYFPCETAVGSETPPCPAVGGVFQDVEDVMRSTTAGAVPTSVTVCVSDTLDAIATVNGTLSVDLTLSAFATQRGDSLASVTGTATAGLPTLLKGTELCPSFPDENPNDGDTEF